MQALTLLISSIIIHIQHWFSLLQENSTQSTSEDSHNVDTPTQPLEIKTGDFSEGMCQAKPKALKINS